MGITCRKLAKRAPATNLGCQYLLRLWGPVCISRSAHLNINKINTVRNATQAPATNFTWADARSVPPKSTSHPPKIVAGASHALNHRPAALGGRLGRDLSGHNNRDLARSQRISVSGRTTTKASRQLNSHERTVRLIRVTGSIRRGLTPRSIYSPSCRRKNRFSALIDRLDRNESAHQRNISPTNWIRIAEIFGIDESCHTLKSKVRDRLIDRCVE